MSMAALLSVAVLNQTPAAGPARSYRIVGAGAETCANWTAYKRKDDPARYGAIDWVLGYLSSFNSFVSADGDVSRNLPAEQIAAWIDTYCEDRPRESVANAALALIAALKGANGVGR